MKAGMYDVGEDDELAVEFPKPPIHQTTSSGFVSTAMRPGRAADAVGMRRGDHDIDVHGGSRPRTAGFCDVSSADWTGGLPGPEGRRDVMRARRLRHLRDRRSRVDQARGCDLETRGNGRSRTTRRLTVLERRSRALHAGPSPNALALHTSERALVARRYIRRRDVEGMSK